MPKKYSICVKVYIADENGHGVIAPSWQAPEITEEQMDEIEMQLKKAMHKIEKATKAGFIYDVD